MQPTAGTHSRTKHIEVNYAHIEVIQDGSQGTGLADLRSTAESLRTALDGLLRAIPGGPRRQTTLAQQLHISRVTVSLLQSAIRRESPLEFLEAVPGPESLRGVANGARALGADERIVLDAEAQIERFASLIRHSYGTRAALTAAIGSGSTGLRARVDLSARGEVFRGMRRILGVEARAWLTCMFFLPSAEDDECIDVTTLHGALGMRRLRSDTNVYFTFGPPRQSVPSDQTLSAANVHLDDLLENEPAQIEHALVGGQLRHRLVSSKLGKRALTDMLVVSRNPKGSRRYATRDEPLRGISLFVDVPSQVLICDAVVHRDVFPDVVPETIVYNPGPRGPANPNDRARDADKITVSERTELITSGPDRWNIAEVPRYAQMIERVCEALCCPQDVLRVHRFRIAYPVHGFQYVLGFRAPMHRASPTP